MAPIATAQVGSMADATEINEILNLMSAHDQWQDRYLIEYEAFRKFYGANQRFKMESVLEVKTVFRQPDTFRSEVIRSEGSKVIRERVFNKILEAEQETQKKEARKEVRIAPSNYNFALLGKEDCEGRACYHLRITPRKADKYSIDGQIWIDADEGAIIRVQGKPAKRPSFWTRNTEIERRYTRVEGVWLCSVMESVSDILIGGRSTLKVEYTYVAVQTEATLAREGRTP